MTTQMDAADGTVPVEQWRDKKRFLWLMGLIAIVVMSLAVGLLPALRARRLKIVDALAGR